MTINKIMDTKYLSLSECKSNRIKDVFYSKVRCLERDFRDFCFLQWVSYDETRDWFEQILFQTRLSEGRNREKKNLGLVLIKIKELIFHRWKGTRESVSFASKQFLNGLTRNVLFLFCIWQNIISSFYFCLFRIFCKA